jgi:RimJ/RimL family protein N-acetyltransferase
MPFLIETERLGLRELMLGDAENVARFLLDQQAMRYYDRVYSSGDETAWIKSNLERYRKDGFGLWAMIRKADGAFLGDCGITLQDIEGEKLPEVGYHVIREYQRKGYASEAAAASLDYAFREFRFPAVFSYCRPDNHPSRGVMEKIGMRFLKEYSSCGRDHAVYRMEAVERGSFREDIE